MASKKTIDSYNYKNVSIYFDMDNPYQRECYNLLQKIQKKKSLFLGMLAHNFLMQFENEEITAEELRNYINSYEFICRMNKQAPFNTVQHDSHGAAEELQHKEPKVIEKAPEPVQPTPERAPAFENMDSLMNAMNAFSI